eukprot:2847508-Prymnesium_polylepis.1
MIASSVIDEARKPHLTGCVSSRRWRSATQRGSTLAGIVATRGKHMVPRDVCSFSSVETTAALR